MGKWVADRAINFYMLLDTSKIIAAAVKILRPSKFFALRWSVPPSNGTGYMRVFLSLLLDIKYPMRRRLRYQFVRKGQGKMWNVLTIINARFDMRPCRNVRVSCARAEFSIAPSGNEKLFARSFFASTSNAGNYTDRCVTRPVPDEAIHHPRNISTSAINGFWRHFNTIAHSRTFRGWRVLLAKAGPPFEAAWIFALIIFVQTKPI